MNMNWILGGIAIALFTIGLVGQAFEMRKIRASTYRDEELASPKILELYFGILLEAKHNKLYRSTLNIRKFQLN